MLQRARLVFVVANLKALAMKITKENPGKEAFAILSVLVGN
jgi:hypothetical protein